MNSISSVHPVPQIRNLGLQQRKACRFSLLYPSNPSTFHSLPRWHPGPSYCISSRRLSRLPVQPLHSYSGSPLIHCPSSSQGKKNFLKCPDPYHFPAENSDSSPLGLGREPSPRDGSGVQPHHLPPASLAVSQSCYPRLPRLPPLPGKFFTALTPSPAGGVGDPVRPCTGPTPS